MITKWRDLPGEGLEMYSPIGLIPTDFFTSKDPVGRLKVFLDREDGGKWQQTDIKEVRTASSIIAYPGLGREAVASQVPRRYRVRVDAEFYLPLYPNTPNGPMKGIEFDCFSYNDTTPPANYPTQPIGFPNYLNAVLRKLWLVPAPNYPFPGHVLVMRGVVVDGNTGQQVGGAEVTWGNKEKALTDESGVFGLPLRVKEKKHLTDEQTIDANDRQKPPRQGLIDKIIIPTAVGTNQTIPIF